MIETALRIIPKGIEEYTTIFGLLGILLFLLSPHVKTKWKLAFAFLILFIFFWRMGFSRIKRLSSRYSSGMIIPFVLLSVYCFHELRQSEKRVVRWFAAIILAVLLLNYIKEDLKRNKRDMNYYAVAELVKKNIADRKEIKFFVSKKDYNRISFLSRTDDIGIAQNEHYIYRNNYENPYFPSTIEIDSDNHINIHNSSKKWICSLLTGKSANKRINLFHSTPLIHLEINPTFASIDTSKSLLQNGTLEEIDSEKESHRKLATNIFQYRSYFTYDGSVRTPQNAYFHVTEGVERLPSVGIESIRPIDGKDSASIKFNDGTVFFLFSQTFHNGKYSYSFLVQGKKGTMIYPLSWINRDKKWNRILIGLFTIPDSRIYQISCSIDVDGLKEADYFIVGAKVQNGEALLDDFILNRKEDLD